MKNIGTLSLMVSLHVLFMLVIILREIINTSFADVEDDSEDDDDEVDEDDDYDGTFYIF